MVAVFVAIATALLSPAGILLNTSWSEGSLALKIVSILSIFGAVYFFYKAYMQASWDNYWKRIQFEPVSPPKDRLAIFLQRAKKWLKF